MPLLDHAAATSAKVGDKFDITFGVAPAQAFCTEVTNDKTGKRSTFRVMAFGVQVADLYSLVKPDNTVAFGEA